MTPSTRTFVDLSTGRRRVISRRALLTDLGIAGVGLTVLGACAGSSDSSPATTAAPSTDASAGADPATTDPATTDPATTDPATTEAMEESEGSVAPEESAGAGPLQFEHVVLGNVSAYVLLRGNEATIVDTGRSDSRDAILEGMEALSVSPDMVRHIVLTHNHGDHAGGLANLEVDLNNATVHVGATDIESIQSTLSLEELNDGDEIFGMGVIGTPGHTPGSISLFDTETGLLVAGDAINGDGEGGLTGANPSFTPDLDEAARSVEKLAALMPTIAAFGHGGAPVSVDVAAKLAAL